MLLTCMANYLLSCLACTCLLLGLNKALGLRIRRASTSFGRFRWPVPMLVVTLFSIELSMHYSPGFPALPHLLPLRRPD